MKKLRALPVAALLLGLLLSAFTSQHKTIKTNDPLWFYKLTSTTGEDDRTNYEALTDQDEDALCPGQSEVYCVIEAPEFGSTNTPDLDHMDQVISNKP